VVKLKVIQTMVLSNLPEAPVQEKAFLRTIVCFPVSFPVNVTTKEVFKIKI